MSRNPINFMTFLVMIAHTYTFFLNHLIRMIDSLPLLRLSDDVAFSSAIWRQVCKWQVRSARNAYQITYHWREHHSRWAAPPSILTLILLISLNIDLDILKHLFCYLFFVNVIMLFLLRKKVMVIQRISFCNY